MGAAEHDDPLGVAEVILQCLLGEPGTVCSKASSLHVGVGRDTWMSGMGKCAWVSPLEKSEWT